MINTHGKEKHAPSNRVKYCIQYHVTFLYFFDVFFVKDHEEVSMIKNVLNSQKYMNHSLSRKEKVSCSLRVKLKVSILINVAECNLG